MSKYTTAAVVYALVVTIVASLIVLLSHPVCAASPTIKDEQQVKPACAGIVDAKAWTNCMAKFKDIRPKHEPTNLIFKDWRT